MKGFLKHWEFHKDKMFSIPSLKFGSCWNSTHFPGNYWTSLKVKQSQKIFKLETQVDDLASQLASPKNLVRKIVNENTESEKEISADAFGEIFGLYQAKQRIQPTHGQWV